jgi:hypothetical protein
MENQTTREEYIQLYNEIVGRQTIVLGPDMALVIARKTAGLQFSPDGKISGFEGEPQLLLQSLIAGYVNLSGQIVQKTIEPLLSKYPGAAAQVAAGQAAGILKKGEA